MDWVEDTVNSFGRNMGIENLAFNENNLVCLDIEKMGTLYIEVLEEKVLVYLSREIPLHQEIDLKKAMALCHYNEKHPVVVNPCMKDDRQMIFLASIPAADFALPLLENTVNHLDKLHNSLFKQ